MEALDVRRSVRNARPVGPPCRALLLGALVVVLAWCRAVPDPTATTRPSVVPTAPGTPGAPAFPQVAAAAGEFADLAALIEGTLVVEDGCLRVARPDRASVLIVWPAEATLRTDGGMVRVADGRGRAVAQVGQPVRLGGGELSREAISALPGRPLRAPLPPNCPAPYWLAARLAAPGPAGSGAP